MAQAKATSSKVQDLTTWTPVQVDTVLAANWDEQARLMNRIQRTQHAADHYTKAGLLALAQRHLDEVQQYRTALQAAIAQAKPYEAEYTRRRWHRYFLVTNGNGHVHRERSCSTCYPTTTYAWLVTLSGCDERAMVTEYGTDACSVCFPNAPVLARQLGVVSKTQREREAARAERAAKKAARDAKAAVKAIANPDGSKLVDQSGWTVRTLATARQELVRTAGTLQFAQPGSYSDQRRPQVEAAFERIAAAIAHKTGEDVQALKTAARTKAAKRGY